MVRPTSLPFLATTFALVALAASASSCSVLIDTKTTQCNTNADCASLNTGGAGTSVTCSAARVCVTEQPTAGGGNGGSAGSDKPECEENEDCSALNNDFGDATCSDAGKCVAAEAPVLLEPTGCVEPEVSPAATVTLSFDVSLTAPPSEPKDRKPFSIRVCQTTDPLCAGSPPENDIIVPYGELAKVPVKPGVRGYYLEIRNPDGLPAMEFLGRPINEDTTGYSLIIPTPASVASLVAFTQETYNAERGVFVVTTRDCDRLPLAGVAVSNTLEGTPFIFDNRIPQKSLKETTKDGGAGFVNVPAGFPILSAVLNGTQKMSNNSAISRGGWVTYVEMFP